MKIKISKLVLLIIAISLVSCENNVVMNTKVHEDGSLDKTILLDKTNISDATENVFGVSEATGWNVEVTRDTLEENKDSDATIGFTKHFNSADEINKELDQEYDSLFRIHSTFEKRFRWFYTYIYYAETFRPIDRLKMIDVNDYFTPEDWAFIDRLPGEGRAISRADSLYLQLLNEKIFEHYANRGLFNEQFEILKEVVRRNAPGEDWVDTLESKRELLFHRMIDKVIDDPLDVNTLVDTLHFPIEKSSAENDYEELSDDLRRRIDFMGYARDGKYVNSIEMPWPVFRSNADSVAGNTVFWKPLATKFAISEFTMVAESRQFNWWAAAITAALIGVTIFLFVRKRS